MGAVFTASTNAVAPADRIEFWNAGSQRIGGAKATPLSDVFDAEVVSRRLDDLLVFALKSTPHQVTANSVCLGTGRTPALRLRYQQSGTSKVVCGERSSELHVGDWIVTDTRLPHEAINQGDASHLWLQIPFSRLSDAEIAAARRMHTRLPMAGRVSGMLCECMRYAVETLDDLSPRSEADLARIMTDMFRTALIEAGEAEPARPTLEVTAQRVRSFIDSHLHDPDLSVERIAKAVGCTTRYVHKAFEGRESVSRYIWNRRLDLCRKRLERQPQTSTTLTALAFDHGFSSSSHFSRSFRDRFGTSPSAYLAAIRGKLD